MAFYSLLGYAHNWEDRCGGPKFYAYFSTFINFLTFLIQAEFFSQQTKLLEPTSCVEQWPRWIHCIFIFSSILCLSTRWKLLWFLNTHCIPSIFSLEGRAALELLQAQTLAFPSFIAWSVVFNVWLMALVSVSLTLSLAPRFWKKLLGLVFVLYELLLDSSVYLF